MAERDMEPGMGYALARSVGAATLGIATILWGMGRVMEPDVSSLVLLLPFGAGGMAFFAAEAVCDAVRDRLVVRRPAPPARRDPEMGAVSA